MKNLRENLEWMTGNPVILLLQEMRTYAKRCSFLEKDRTRSNGASLPGLQFDPTAAASTGTARSYSHSLFGHAITGPDFKNFSTKYSFPQLGHFSGIGLCAEVNLHLG